MTLLPWHNTSTKSIQESMLDLWEVCLLSSASNAFSICFNYLMLVGPSSKYWWENSTKDLVNHRKILMIVSNMKNTVNNTLKKTLSQRPKIYLEIQFGSWMKNVTIFLQIRLLSKFGKFQEIYKLMKRANICKKPNSRK